MTSSDRHGEALDETVPSVTAEPYPRRRRRVVYLDHVARLSGGEIALARLLRAAREDVEAYVILGEEGPLVEPLLAAGAKVEVLGLSAELREARKDRIRLAELPFAPVLEFIRYVMLLRKRLLQIRPDLIHTNSLKSAVYGGIAGRLSCIPVVWHIHDRIAPDYLPSAAVRALRLLARFLPTRVIANSVTTLSTLPFNKRSDVLYNAVVPDLAPDRPAPRQRESFPPLLIGVVGRISPWKGKTSFSRRSRKPFRAVPSGLA